MAQREVYVGTRFRAHVMGHDASSVASALANREPGIDRVMVTDHTDLMKAVRRGTGAWRLHVIERTAPRGTKPIGFARTDRRGVDTAVAHRALASYLEGTDEWRTAVRWRKGLAGRSPFVLIPAVFFIGTAIVLGVQAASGGLDGWSWEYLPNLIVGIAMISLFTMYAAFFADVVRPRLARWLGARLGLEITESTDVGIFSSAGAWQTEEGSPAKRATVTLIDLVVLLVGAIVPIAVIGVGVVLAAQPILA